MEQQREIDQLKMAVLQLKSQMTEKRTPIQSDKVAEWRRQLKVKNARIQQLENQVQELGTLNEDLSASLNRQSRAASDVEEVEEEEI